MQKANRELANRGYAWKVGLALAILMSVITSIPQLYLVYVRGSDWNGSCAYLDTDELPYAAYTNALVDGRPRRNDPVTGNDGSESESLFSIQFAPPLVIATLARILNISAATAFIVLQPLATLAAALMVFWLCFELTNNSLLSTAGTAAVLALGTAAAHSPLQILMGVDTGYGFFPFLRRYIPAVPFPVFLAFTVFTWRALTRHCIWAIASTICLAFLIYSYFFLWTAAVAWLFTILVVWFFARPNDRQRVLATVSVTVVIAIVPCLIYAWLLSKRAQTIDTGQLLGRTHTADLLRAPELYGALVLLLIGYQFWRRTQTYDNPKILFVVSFALAPFVVFNQQIITGRTLQPFHYEEFVANYWVVIAALLALGILRPELPKRVAVYIGLAGFGTAIMLSVFAARMTLASNIRLDEARAVGLKFKRENLAGVVFASDFRLTNSLAVTARNPVLWSRYLYTFSHVTSGQQKKRYFQYLYFSGVDETRLEYLLRNDFFARWEVFGADRTNPVLGIKPLPITDQDIVNAVNEYREFIATFNSDLANNPLLSFAVVSPNTDLSRLDKWYERGQAEHLGNFVIYRLSPRLSESSQVR